MDSADDDSLLDERRFRRKPELMRAKRARVLGQDPRREVIETVATELVAMLHPERVRCSFGGREYKPDVDGIVLVPIAAVSQLSAHGFSPKEEAAVPASIEGTGSSFDKPRVL